MWPTAHLRGATGARTSPTTIEEDNAPASVEAGALVKKTSQQRESYGTR